MEKREFIEKIDHIRQVRLKHRHTTRGEHSYLCDAFTSVFNNEATIRRFINEFKPEGIAEGKPWYGHDCWRLSLWRRLRVLRKFERICIKHEYYREF